MKKKGIISLIIVLSMIVLSCSNIQVFSNEATHTNSEFTGISTINNLPGNTTDKQLEFIETHFKAVMTSLANRKVSEAITKPKLFLYRSIQGTWEDFKQIDWDHINSNENMFCHNTDPENPYDKDRILTIWGSWLMNSADFVSPDDPNAMNHWINYYAETVSMQVKESGFDGLFIDSAGHKLTGYAVGKLIPDGYDGDDWRIARQESLIHIKSKLPDHTVIFNGLHNQNGAEVSLRNTDGGLWETFAFNHRKYKGEEDWRETIELTARNTDKMIAIVSKKKGLIADIQARTFLTSSYLLVSNENTYFHLADFDYDLDKTIFWFPEFEINLGIPEGVYSAEDGVYCRGFKDGVVYVNPSENKTKTVKLDGSYKMIIPKDGGVLDKNGEHDGILTYQVVSGIIELPPVSGVILVDDIQTTEE